MNISEINKLWYPRVKKYKEKQRKREMADLKEFCRRTYGENWREHYLKRWKEYRKNEKK